MRKLGLIASSMLVLGAFMGLNAVSALADQVDWERSCGDDPFKQSLELRSLRVATANPYQLEASALSAGGMICGPWAARVNEGGDPIDYGAYTFAVRTDIYAPPGTQVEPTIALPDNLYLGGATIRMLTWQLGYQFNPGIWQVDLNLLTDSRRQVNPDSANPEQRKGCPRDGDIPEGQTLVVCAKGGVPFNIFSNWVWSVRTDGDPKDPGDDTFVHTIGEPFGPGGRYTTLTRIVDYFQCERVGTSSFPRCGSADRPNLHFNGYADDAKCSVGFGLYYVVVTRRDGQTAESTACMPWQKRS